MNSRGSLREWHHGVIRLRLAVLALLAASCGDAMVEPVTPEALHRRRSIDAWRVARALADAYVPKVRAGNSVALGSARVPFAKYIVAVHSRLHQLFAEELLAARDMDPDLRGSEDMVVDIELVLDQEEGRIAGLGVIQSSGSVAFDMVALDAFRRAAPFGAPPSSIVSPGGKVYIHWTLRTAPTEACAPRNARPFLLASPPPLP